MLGLDAIDQYQIPSGQSGLFMSTPRDRGNSEFVIDLESGSTS